MLKKYFIFSFVKQKFPINMQKLSDNFTLQELTFSSMAQRLKISNFPDEARIENLRVLCQKVLQPIRNRWGNPITVTSGFRCEKLNKLIGGSALSQHLNGEAADIICFNNKELWNLIVEMIKNEEIEVGQLIDEKNLKWIHISLPSGKHRNQILSIH